MGDNGGKTIFRNLPYNAASPTTLWHHVDPKHSIVSSFLCTSQRQAIPLSVPGQLTGDTQSKQKAHLLIRICAHLEFLIDFKKSELIPTQVFDFVGIHFNLCLDRVYITQNNWRTESSRSGSGSEMSISCRDSPGAGNPHSTRQADS